MSREIKFRVWFEVERLMDYDPSTDDSLLNANFGPHFGEVFMQYTGLKDKNGVEIFEGDVVRTRESDSDRWRNGGVIEWWNDRWVIHRPTLIGKAREYAGLWPNRMRLEVIGNIYENPELLEPNHGA